MDRGADISWISQYPHEKEKLSPPMCALSVDKSETRCDGNVIVLSVRTTLNQHALTLSQIIARRKVTNHTSLAQYCTRRLFPHDVGYSRDERRVPAFLEPVATGSELNLAWLRRLC